MKRILITGKNSYIGNKFEEWVLASQDDYYVNKISVRDKQWEQMDWSSFDVVLNVAGIAHIKETDKNAEAYYNINRDLAIAIAKKAKKENVAHFIQISTMSVFGKENGLITKETPMKPNNHYGRSKLEADIKIKELEDQGFIVSIIRPPMVYGKASPGNYQKLSDFVKKMKIFPKVNNRRSMIFVNNLSEYIKKIIEYQLKGEFYPQNNEYSNTFELVRAISIVNEFDLIEIPNVLNWISVLQYVIPKANKVFGDLIYDKELSEIYDQNHRPIKYNVVDFIESVELTEDN